MSVRPLSIFSGVSRRLIALAALAVLLAAPSHGHAAHTPVVPLLPFIGAQSFECGDGTKFVVATVSSHFQGTLMIFKNGRQVSYLEANIEDPVRKPLEERLEDFCESLGHSQAQSSVRTTSHGITAGEITVDTGGQGAADAVGGDFNGDGRPDFAVANQDSNNVSILLNLPGGTLQSGVTFPAGAGPQRIKAADFNKDGAVDLITANVGNGLVGNLTVLLGNGNGTFQPPIAVAAGTLPVDVAVGDWNGDGKLDIAAADSRGFAVVVRLGNGDGTFQPPLVLPTSEAPQSIVAADLNGDGKLDLATNGSILLGNGNGTFQAAVSFATGFRPTLVRVADVNGDGKPDLITASSTGGLISVLLGAGNGTFQAPRHYTVGRSPSEVVIVDLDEDGTLDLVVSNLSDDHISALFGRGDGTFRGALAYAAVPDLSIRQGAVSVAVADVNGDGIPDVVAANDRTNANGLPAAVVLPGLGLGRFGAPVVIPNQNGSAVVAGDWNNDGKIDVAFTVQGSPGTSRLSVLLNTGNFAFTPMAPIVLPDSDAFTDFLATADLNHDGKADLIVANTGAASVSLFLGDGAGNFAAQSPVPVGTRPNWVAIGDVNGDGKLDLIVSGQGDFGAVNGTLSVHLGNGDGSFLPAQTILGGIAPNSVAVGDFNGDGKLDVAAVVEKPLFTWSLSVFLGNGDGTFAALAPAALFQSPAGAVRVADVDLDGHLDLVVGLEGSALGVLRGRGDGTFEPPVRSDAGGTLAVIADVNRDARPDAVAATGLGAVTVLLNDTLTAALPTTVASVLPASRAVSVGATATAFTTILNPSASPFTGCDITPIATLPGTFLYQTTDRATNAPTGAPNTRVTIPAGDFQTFVIAFTPSGAFPATEVEFAFACDGVIPAAAIRSVNTLRLSASATPGPDIIALAASSPPGRLVVAGAAAFAVATANVGVSGTVRVAADTGGAALPLALAWCQTDPATGVCLGAPTSAPLEVVVGAGATPTFAIFGAAAGDIAFDPASHRVFFRILSLDGQVIGATSVAVSGGP